MELTEIERVLLSLVRDHGESALLIALEVIGRVLDEQRA